MRPGLPNVNDPTGDSIIDVDRLFQVILDVEDGAVLLEIYNEYKTNSLSCLDTIYKHAEAGDSDSIRKIAHRLKGTSLIFGATALTTLLNGIENNRTAQSVSDLFEIHIQVAKSVKEALAKLEELIPIGISRQVAMTQGSSNPSQDY